MNHTSGPAATSRNLLVGGNLLNKRQSGGGQGADLCNCVLCSFSQLCAVVFLSCVLGSSHGLGSVPLNNALF